MVAAGKRSSLQPRLTLGSTATNLPLTPVKLIPTSTLSEADAKQRVSLILAHPPVAVVEPGDITVDPAPPIALIELYRMMPLVPSTMPLLAVAIMTFR